jgi:hypothetical protein
MENFEHKGNYDSLDLTFLRRKVSQLRLQKGRYISDAFAENIHNIYQALSLAIHKSSQSPVRVISPILETMPDNMVDCCLRCIEEILQGLIATQNPQEKSQIFSELEDIAQDFYSLYFYIRYSIDPQKFIADQKALSRAVGFYIPEDEV